MQPNPPDSTSTQQQFCWVQRLLLAIAWLMHFPLSLGAIEIESIVLGFDNQFRLGEYAPITVILDSQSDGPNIRRLEVDCVDPDGNLVTFRQPAVIDPSDQRRVYGLFKLGRANGELAVRLLDSAGAVLANHQVNLRGSAETAISISPPTGRLIVHIGTSPRLEQIFPPFVGRQVSIEPIRVIRLDSPEQLPPVAIGLQNIDTLIVSTSEMAGIESWSQPRIEAIENWLRNGGKLFFWSSPTAKSVVEIGGRFSRFMPGQLEGFAEIKSTSRLDFLVKAKQPLIGIGEAGFEVARVTPDNASIMLAQDETPLLLRRQFGMGQVIFSAMSLDQPPLVDWEGTPRLLEQVVLKSRVGEERGTESANQVVASQTGYQDLIGQLRVPLEQFQNVKFISFTTVATLIGLLIILVGPVDYFLLHGLLRQRMEVTWLTFPLIILGFSLLAIWLTNRSRPTEPQVNHLEMVDLDGRTGQMRGTAWTCIYSPQAGLHSITPELLPGLPQSVESTSISWLGQSSEGLGGLGKGTGIRSRERAYFIDWDASNGQSNAVMREFPFPVRSTRSFQFEWQSKSSIPVQSQLIYKTAISRLTGSFTNPYNVPLNNCRLYYGNWAYLFDQPILAGSSIDVESEARERTVKSILTQRDRMNNEGKTQNAPWDPTSIEVSRILEMIMFHEAAGGQPYTSLANRFHSRLEMSDHLDLTQAILVAELPEAASQLRVDGAPIENGRDKQYTVLRVCLPVEVADLATSEQHLSYLAPTTSQRNPDVIQFPDLLD